jgi:Holliday junction DNA helicase RuvA
MLHTHLVVREDAQLLYGFAQPEERELFLMLLGVSGVGANTARMILSAMDPNAARNAIQQGDVNAMKSVKGNRRENSATDHHRSCKTKWEL